jgi:hypothetical protein
MTRGRVRLAPEIYMTNYAPCPQCGISGAEKMSFTWWGGILGPRLFTHVKCGGCGKQYNGKTGRDNTNNIVIYCIVVGFVCLGLVIVMFAALGLVMFAAR